MARTMRVLTRTRMWGLIPVACLPIMVGCDEQQVLANPTIGVELRVAPTIHPDTDLEIAPDRRSVTVSAERWAAATAIALTVEAESTMSVVRVDSVEVMRPEELLRIERWSAKGNIRPLLLEVARCDSIRMTVTEEVRAAEGGWIRNSSELRQNGPLPNCCEATLRRRSEGR